MAKGKKVEEIIKAGKGEAKLLYCGCKSDKNGVSYSAEYQDRMYGLGTRVCNKTMKKKGAESVYYVCTVCGRQH